MNAETALLAERVIERTGKAGAAFKCSNDLKNGRAFYCLDNIEIKCGRDVTMLEENLIEREPTSSL